MACEHDLLLAIDDSEATRRAVEYVAGTAGSAGQIHIRLFHVLPHIPTGLLEHGGHQDPAREAAASQELDEQTAVWRERCERAAESLVDAARLTLELAGVDRERITVEFAAPLPEESTGYHIVQAARARGCGTVVVGRAPRRWLGQAFYSPTSRALLGRKVRDLAVWIVT